MQINLDIISYISLAHVLEIEERKEISLNQIPQEKSNPSTNLILGKLAAIYRCAEEQTKVTNIMP